MMSRKPKPVPVEHVSIQQQALDDAGGDMSLAVEMLSERLLADRTLCNSMLPQLVHCWASDAIRDLLQKQRRSVIRAIDGSGSSAAFGAALGQAMRNEATRLMDMPIFGGKRLADATPEELRESARRYDLVATDARRKARFHQLVADAAAKKGDGPIGKTLTERTLITLWEKSDA
jgi:hypothetical protein